MFSRTRTRIQLPPVLAIPFGLLMAAGGGWFVFDNLQFRMVAVPVMGHVDSVSTQRSGTRRTYHAQVSFEERGRRHTATVSSYRGASGAPIALLYDPSDPSDARQNTTPTFNILFGTLFMGIGLFAAGSLALKGSGPEGFIGPA